MSEDLTADLNGALARDTARTTALVRALAPVVQVRVARALVGRGKGGRSVREEVSDLTQDVLCTLFADDARVLRSWDKERGLSLRNFVGLVAERHVTHVFRSGRKNPWKDEPIADVDLARHAGATVSPEAAVVSRDTFGHLWKRLAAELSPRGLELFRVLVVEERPVEDVCREMQMQSDAVYAWRSRLLKRARALLAELSPPVSENAPQRPTPINDGGQP